MSTYPGFPNATHYSPNFNRAELDCRRSSGCGCTTPPDVAANLVVTANNLEQLRAFVGHALHVNDGYRCPKENAAVGGVPDSQHLVGKAADVDAGGSNGGVDYLASKATGVPAYHLGGIGKYYEGHGLFVHVDWRGWEARWQEPE